MDIGQHFRELRDSPLGKVALFFVRVPGAVSQFALDYWTARQQDQAWRKHGRTLDIRPDNSEPWIPNGQQH